MKWQHEMGESRETSAAPVVMKQADPVACPQHLPAQPVKQPRSVLIADQDGGSFDRLAMLRSNLEHCLSILDDEVLKGYLTQLSSHPIVPMEEQSLAALEKK